MNARLIVQAAILFCLPLAASTIYAEQQRPAWAHPDVLKAAIQINMDKAQQDQFRASIAAFLEGYVADVQRLMRGNNQSGLPRKIRSKRRARVSTMDEQMTEVLSEEQFPAYENYRDILLAKMEEFAKMRR